MIATLQDLFSARLFALVADEEQALEFLDALAVDVEDDTLATLLARRHREVTDARDCLLELLPADLKLPPQRPAAVAAIDRSWRRDQTRIADEDLADILALTALQSLGYYQIGAYRGALGMARTLGLTPAVEALERAIVCLLAADEALCSLARRIQRRALGASYVSAFLPGTGAEVS